MDFSNVAAIRQGIAHMCLTPSFRINPPHAAIGANRWRPYTVTDSATLSLYTDRAAWEFIAKCLMDDCKVTCSPPDSKHDDYAYIMIEANDKVSLRIYMKIAIKPPHKNVRGISFHREDPR